jgi:hypothetical protein
VRHPIDSFIDGSVASGYQNQIGSTIYGTARDLACVPGTGGGYRIDSNAVRVQQLYRPSKRMLSPSESARVRIINEYGLLVARDSTLIIVDASQ